MSLNLSNTPIVSVACITYNHAKYIREAIESFLMQKTNFSYEILIHDDASTDGTDQIIKEYELKYPNLIFPTYQSENQFSKGVRRIHATFVFPKCRGKYIALCEGDDYWTDPLKLQKQCEYLETNPEFGLVFTDADYLYERNNQLIRAYDKTFRRHLPTGDVLNDLLYDNPYKTCTALFRTCLTDDYNRLVINKNFTMGDYPLWLIIAGKAKVGYMGESTAVYRIRNNSASHFHELGNRISFLKSTYRISVYFSTYYNVKINKKKLKKKYYYSVLNYLAQKKRFKILFSYAGCFPLALALIWKEWLWHLIVWRVNRFK